MSGRMTVGFENCLFASETVVYSRANASPAGNIEAVTSGKQLLQIIHLSLEPNTCWRRCAEMSVSNEFRYLEMCRH